MDELTYFCIRRDFLPSHDGKHMTLLLLAALSNMRIHCQSLADNFPLLRCNKNSAMIRQVPNLCNASLVRSMNVPEDCSDHSNSDDFVLPRKFEFLELAERLISSRFHVVDVERSEVEEVEDAGHDDMGEIDDNDQLMDHIELHLE